MNTVDHHFRRQYGLITRSQAIAAGMSASQIHRRMVAGSWVRERRGVYRHAAVAESWESRLLGACLASGGVASHRSAAALWGLGMYQHPTPEVVVDRRCHSVVPKTRVHLTTQWELRDETVIRGIPVTGINRTLLDCGAVTPARGGTGAASCAPCWRCVWETRRCRCRTSAGWWRTSWSTTTCPSRCPSTGSTPPTGRSSCRPTWPGRFAKRPGSWTGWPSIFGRTERERDNRKRNRAKAEGWNIQEILWSMYVDDADGLVALCRQFLAS